MGQLEIHRELKLDMSYGAVEWFDCTDDDVWLHLQVPQHLEAKFRSLVLKTTDNDEGFEYILVDNNGQREYADYDDLMDMNRRTCECEQE